jgi:hypothetical protein
MAFLAFALGVTALFFISSLILLHYGRQLGLRYMAKQGVDSMAGLPTIEGAVFALIGLLLAFTISGALQRFDERRQLVVQEANALATAYDRLDLLGPAAPALQGMLKQYSEARLDLYAMPHDFSVWERAEIWSPDQLARIADLKREVWDGIVSACPPSNFLPACGLGLTGLNNAFEVARLRQGAAEKHPPQIVYILLFGLGLGGSLLAGFGMAAAAARSWVHMMMFAATLSIALYAVTDMEFPRLGLIRIESFDHFLADVGMEMRDPQPVGTSRDRAREMPLAGEH